MGNILEVFTSAWTAMPEDRRQRILDEVSPNRVVRGVLYSLSAYYDAQHFEGDPQDVEVVDPSDEDIIDAEFVETKLGDGFGA